MYKTFSIYTADEYNNYSTIDRFVSEKKYINNRY